MATDFPILDTDRIVCHCLNVRESEILGAIAAGRIECLRSAMQQTAAGTGCTACHGAVRKLLAQELPDQSPSSPTCVVR